MALGYFGQQTGATNLGSPYLRDYRHASQTFINGGYAPKLKFLFHTYFEINQEVYSPNINTGQNFGVAVKTVKLPSYTFATQTLNQYNRKRIVQTKIKYNPVNITFHDDSNNVITKLWAAYYTYYYTDGRNISNIFNGARGNIGFNESNSIANNNYNTRNTYESDISGSSKWGYTGEGRTPNLRKIPFFKNITVFGFNQHKFTAYTLINPLITSFNHDTYSYSEGNGTMEMQMDLDYETVVYNEGAIDGRAPDNIVQGFGLAENYDRFPGPYTQEGSNSLYPGNGGYGNASGGTIFNQPGSEF